MADNKKKQASPPKASTEIEEIPMSDDPALGDAASRRVPLSTTTAYGFGSVAYGVKDNGFGTFLLIFFSQVLGLPPAQVGLALMIALIFDAITDPILGQVSDKTRSKYGRRHPYMYAAIIPIAVAYYFLWNPPAGVVENHAFAYLLVMAIVVRLCVTFFEVPSSALIGELTTDYDDRTRLLAFRYFFGWMGGTGIAIFAWTFLLVPTEQYEHGVLNREAYGQYGLIAVALMVIAITLSAIGTQKRAQAFQYKPEKEPLHIWKNFKEIWATMMSPNFRVLFISAIPGAIAVGIIGSLATYFNTFFWEFTNNEIAMVVGAGSAAALAAPFVTPQIAKHLGKRKAAILTASLALIIAPIPIALRIIGWFPENGNPVLLNIILAYNFVDLTLAISSSILVSSMVADVVEENELRTGRRSEGLFFAARQLVGKTIAGFGLFFGSIILAVIEFPTAAVPGQVDQEILNKLGLVYMPLVVFFYSISIYILSKYRIDRQTHMENLEQLGYTVMHPPNKP